MPPLFLDTSALVRLYDRSEPGAARIARRCRGRYVMLARLARVELASALRRKLRLGEMSVAQVARAWRRFERHRHQRYEVWPLGDDVLDLATELLARRALRAYDALQLATAILAARALAVRGRELRFVTADQNQATAAAAEGLDVELVD